ncbi:hypothetical protein JRQ81_015758 [Phrynocephalus forsythii]|uniref:Cell growth-regulating nucleolar protein-like winged helix domain-containing protein n=1 Tax=Phrynocephalus forsythii TaxID=171643 RepID=A0A9Q1B2F5_9SAUR|nr:hypothetical protein JRQ81_015758 [Phrynocephalus forsythii]
MQKSKRKDLHAKESKSNNLRKTTQHPSVDPAVLEVNGNGLNTQEQRTKTNKKKCGSSIMQKNPKHSETEETAEEHGDNYKFSWKGTIKAILKQAPDNEISVKKLRKKVLAQYYATAGDHHKSEEEILALLNKKISNNPKFRVLKEKVKLLK